MLGPLAIAGSLVVYPSQEIELLKRDLLRLDPQLVVQLSLGSSANPLHRSFKLYACFTGDAKWV